LVPLTTTLSLSFQLKTLLKRGNYKRSGNGTENAVEELRGALESTDWHVFINSSTELDDTVEVVSSYILYLKDSIIPTKWVKEFPNNKPWLDKAVKDALHKKHNAFLHGEEEGTAEAKKEATYATKMAKLQYKSKIEDKFHSLKLNGMA